MNKTINNNLAIKYTNIGPVLCHGNLQLCNVKQLWKKVKKQEKK